MWTGPKAANLGRGGGTPWNYWWGCAAQFSKSRPHFGPKNVIFHSRFQTWPLRIVSSLLRLEEEQKRFLKYHSQFVYFFFFLPHLELKRWIRSYTTTSSLENHTWFHTQMGKVFTRFQTKRVQKPYPLGRHIHIWLLWGNIPPPGAAEHMLEPVGKLPLSNGNDDRWVTTQLICKFFP